ncbi:MAG: flavodoxin family protein [Spirochaetales bacterium]|nr:flavodoxin family protein [Spirochaetales bacterium]
MKITTILGSPRKHGHTARLLAAFEEIIARDFAVARINVIDKRIAGCLGCDACQSRNGVPGCRQKDDFEETIALIGGADAVIYAAPVYVWDFPAQMKALLDRHYCLVKWRRRDETGYVMEGKPAALLATCGGGAAENADLMQAVFQREMDYLRFRVIGKYVADLTTTPDALDAKPLAERMAKDVAGFLGKTAVDRP